MFILKIQYQFLQKYPNDFFENIVTTVDISYVKWHNNNKKKNYNINNIVYTPSKMFIYKNCDSDNTCINIWWTLNYWIDVGWESTYNYTKIYLSTLLHIQYTKIHNNKNSSTYDASSKKSARVMCRWLTELLIIIVLTMYHKYTASAFCDWNFLDCILVFLLPTYVKLLSNKIIKKSTICVLLLLINLLNNV